MSQSQQFIYKTIPEFKSIVGMKATQKIEFFHYSAGTANATIPVAYKGANSFKAQGGIDTTKPVVYMHRADEDFLQGCFINPKEAVSAGSL